MEAKELRINNWVKHNNEFLQVDGIDDIDVFNKQMGEVPLHTVQPIPLTEEILLKCGFEKRYFLNDFFIVINDVKTILIIEIIFDNIFIYLCASNEKKVRLANANFLHQLQNLYFALTCTELEINL